MTRAAELGAQYATVEEILEQPSPLGERLAQLCDHLVRHVAHYTMAAIYVLHPDRPGALTLTAAAGRRPIPTSVPEAFPTAVPEDTPAAVPEAFPAAVPEAAPDVTGGAPGGTCLWSRVAERGETALAQHLAGSCDATRRGWVGAQLAAPLLCRGVRLGVVAIDSKYPAPFQGDDELFVENLGDLIAVRLALAGMAGRG